MPHSVYVLIDPRDDEVRYVGCTTLEPLVRLRGHMANRRAGAKRDWLDELVRCGLVPIIRTELAVRGDHAFAMFAEHAVFCWHRDHRGAQLLNARMGNGSTEYAVTPPRYVFPLPKPSNHENGICDVAGLPQDARPSSDDVFGPMPDADHLVGTGAIRLTARQKLVLDYIAEFLAAHAAAPTMREVMARFGWTSTNGVADYFKALERKGFIQRSGRHIRILRAA